MQNAEPNMYGALATIRNGYMQMQWSRAQMYLVFNTIALPLIFASDTEANVKLVLGIVGMWVTIFIPIAIYRGNVWSKFFNEKMAQLELLDEDGDKATRVLVFSDPRFISIASKRFASRKLFVPLAIVLTSIWLEETVRHGLQVAPGLVGRVRDLLLN
jgi:hypothetical protein